MSGPTEKELEDAHNYAMKKLCENVASKYSSNLTNWNESDKTCRFTKRGCNTEVRSNPFSRPMFDNTGDSVEYNIYDSRFGDIWKRYYPRDTIWKKLNDGRMGCGLKNSLLKRWCEVPGSRATKKIPGLTTNSPPFIYTIGNDGKETCVIPKKYCDDKGVSYDSTKQECRVPEGQKAGEFFGGKTLSRDIRTGSSSVSDKRLKENIKMYQENFLGPGLHLYTFTWNDVAKHLYNKSGEDIGFLADDLPTEDTFIDMYGYRNINLLAGKPYTNRMYLFYKIENIYIK